MTINEALALQTAVKKRLAELQVLRNEVSKKSTSIYRLATENERKEIEEPMYDVKAVDKKITELETFLFKCDSKIKQANAITKIDIEANVEKLLEPLQ